ncbi:MAG: hypothetical protein WD401_04865, partial [Thermomicrobiaceae bacterium]
GETLTVQYFERARFEFVAEDEDGARVTVSMLGANAAAELEQIELVTMDGPCETPPGAGFDVCAPFLDYWNDFGGEASFGLPVTEPFEQEGMTVQLFEYARFEHQPGEWPERYDVLLGRIGAEELAERID